MDLSFGRLSVIDGTPRLFGTSSGLDTAALVDSLVEARRLPAVRLENRLTANAAKMAALGDLRAQLQALRSAANALRNPPGVLGVNDNVFELKTGFLTSSSSTPATDLLGVSLDNQAPSGRYDLVVNQLATARKFMADAVADPAQRLADALNGGAGFSGSIEIGLAGSGTSATIAVSGDMSLRDLRDAINARSQDAGVRASILKVSEAEHRLVLTATETGTEVELSLAGGDDALAILGLSTNGGATFKNPLSVPQSAEIEVDGLSFSRTSNDISDIVEGVTLNLYQAEPGTALTLEIGSDLGAVKEQILGLVDAYNALRGFLASQQTVSADGEVAEGSVLFGSNALRTTALQLMSELGGMVQGLQATAPATLRSLGINFDQRNFLTVDGAKLDEALLTNLDAVRSVFEFRFTASDSDLRVLGRTNALSEQTFTVNVAGVDAEGKVTGADIGGVALEVDGRTLRGPAGSGYEGLVLVWLGAPGSGASSVDVSVTQGLADRLHNTLTELLDEVDGTLANETAGLERARDNLEAQIERINERAEAYRELLIQRFSAMERAMTTAETLLTSLRTSTDAMFQNR